MGKGKNKRQVQSSCSFSACVVNVAIVYVHAHTHTHTHTNTVFVCAVSRRVEDAESTFSPTNDFLRVTEETRPNEEERESQLKPRLESVVGGGEKRGGSFEENLPTAC